MITRGSTLVCRFVLALVTQATRRASSSRALADALSSPRCKAACSRRPPLSTQRHGKYSFRSLRYSIGTYCINLSRFCQVPKPLFSLFQPLIAALGEACADALENLHQQHQQHHRHDHHQVLIAIVAIVDSDLAETAAADDTAHCGVA